MFAAIFIGFLRFGSEGREEAGQVPTQGRGVAWKNLIFVVAGVESGHRADEVEDEGV